MKVSGLLLYDKPAGPTSFRALGAFRKAFPGSKVGHAGTLDSFATGLLLLLAGSYARLAPWFVGLDKSYRAEFVFGRETDTLDPLGDTVAEGPIPSRSALEAVLPDFIGRIAQVPPKYSAVHVSGSRASDLALRGEDFELSPRWIAIRSLELESFEAGRASLRIACSSGTYVRSLARDIARSLGTRAHVGSLRRLSVGPFLVENAVAEIGAGSPLAVMDPGLAASMGLGALVLPRGLESGFSGGKLSALAALDPQLEGREGDFAVFSAAAAFLGLAASRAGRLAYRLVLAEGGAA